MKKVLIIGGGLSGLAAASYLVKNNFNVTLIEATNKLGGKTHSFTERVSGIEMDNGQHILLGCYNETLNFLRMISAIETVQIQNNFSINYLMKDYNIHTLKSFPLPHPFNLFFGFLVFPLLKLKEKISLIKFLLKIKFIDSNHLSDLSVKELLNLENQYPRSVSLFWEIISVGALNTSTEKASAKIFCDILKQIFWTNSEGYKIVLPRKSLNETFIYPSINFLMKHNSIIHLSEKCEQVVISNNKIVKIVSNKRNLTEFDYYLFAIPFYSFKNLGLLDLSSLNLSYSPILNVYFVLKQNPLTLPFYAVSDSNIHWIFNKGNFINITISNAHEISKKSKLEIKNLIIEELEKLIPGIKNQIKNTIVIKQKKATFIPSKDIIEKRPRPKTEICNLFLAGDWTDTKLPSTIEGAIKSGRVAAESIINNHFN
jgi:squalene-associated FAD-dependent desaturase